MYETDNGAGPPPPGPGYRPPEDGPLPDLALYERLIADGIAEADSRGTIVDHVTAALASRDLETETVSLILDATTANIALFAIAAHADEREAHLREVERSGQNLPEGSYGRRNREAIAARETRVAARLRAVEHAYRTAVDRDTRYALPEYTRTPHSPELHADRQIELEAEP